MITEKTMTKRRHVWVLALVAICILAACKSDEDPPANNGGSGGASGSSGEGGGGAGGTSGAGEGGTSGAGEGGTGGGDCGEPATGPNMCTNVGEDEITCPDAVGPFTGVCAPKGECCHRSSNLTKVASLCPDEPMVLEYRVTSSAVMNHPLSTSLPLLLSSAMERARTCAGDQCLLWRFEQPRAGGMPVAGPGKSNVAIGRYNCDGTFSYYNDTVAPNREAEGFTDPTRWNVVEAPTMIDPAMEGAARTKIPWATNPNRRVTTSPFFVPNTMDIDWEVATSGFEILEFDTSDAGRDCQGAWDGAKWETPGRYQTFAPLANNDKDVIDSITQNFCQLLSYSVLPPDDRARACATATDRCIPDGGNYADGGCDWVKLPDALCPETDDQRAMWRCHLGALGNVNQEMGYPEELNCTMTAPTAALDPDVDPAVSKGQCCDPLGAGTDGLPACNAFRIVNQFAAAAAEITDAPASTFPPVCGQ
jgi:hypothetical protein